MKLRSEILLAGIAMSLAAAPAVAMPHGKPGLWTIVSTMKMANMPDLPPEVLAMMKKRGTPGMGQPTTTQMCMTDEQVKAGDVLKNERPDCTTKVISQTATSATTEVTCKGDMAGTGRSTINWRGDTHYEGSYSFNGSIQGQANAMSTSYTGDFVKPDCGAVKPFNAKNMAMPAHRPPAPH